MGAGASSMVGPDGDGPGLGDLPEACVAAVLVYLDPPDICRVARLNRAFRGAASADYVWESKLPSNYAYLICKKEIYARLCKPNPFDGGTKILWLEKWKGGVCLSISSKALSITGIDDRRYWNYIPTEESRFQTVAYLQQIWWFEVEGEIEFCFPAGDYEVFFRLQLGRTCRRLGRRVCNAEHIHGWDVKPVRFQLRGPDGEHAAALFYLVEPGSWVYYRAGGFTAEGGGATKLGFSMRQIDCTHTKGGLCVDSVLICPTGLVPRHGGVCPAT
ncbi:unnamed protein product [Spirodela intermedia]|uniref:F-box domain-containing protein n=1 Tax=Spirodela intermedia TaxID=51605 RepID=A0A7I8J1U1_SPIIN|nr:unnamed protein product [Spirodela intermedia]CAA6663361.1 unnamed protein product [Spirodela intermedia]